MKPSPVALIVMVLAASPALAKSAGGTTHAIAKAALVAAAKAAPLRLVDNLETYCDGETTVAAWLEALTASEAKAVAWTAGACELTNDLNPLDAGGSYCVQATLTLKHPKGRDDRPEIEIYLEDPKHGRPGAAYAFRSVFKTIDGPDYERDRKTFEAEWRERFPSAPPSPCQDDG